MTTPDEHSVREMLKSVTDLRTGRTAASHVSGISLIGDRVQVALEINPADASRMESFRVEVEKRLTDMEGISGATVVLTAEGGLGAPRSIGLKALTGSSSTAPAAGIKHVIAVASGKGGVGKSTIAVNLAVAFSLAGSRVGLLDADVYGPSVPRMMGVTGKPTVKSGRIVSPLQAYGIKCISMGLMVAEDTAMIWRGPMVSSAVEQMVSDVDWGELDLLVVDLPPGTGDIQMTLVQKVPLAGAVIVSTPQDISLLDARRGVAMFREVRVPILGLIENMSYHVCSSCGHRETVFGHGGAEREAARLGIPFLGGLPLTRDMRIGADDGRPLVLTQPDGEIGRSFVAYAETLWKTLESGTAD